MWKMRMQVKVFLQKVKKWGTVRDVTWQVVCALSGLYTAKPYLSFPVTSILSSPIKAHRIKKKQRLERPCISFIPLIHLSVISSQLNKSVQCCLCFWSDHFSLFLSPSVFLSFWLSGKAALLISFSLLSVRWMVHRSSIQQYYILTTLTHIY